MDGVLDILAQAGMTCDDLISVQVTTTDIDFWELFNDIYLHYVATANNNKGDLASWVNGLLIALPELLEKYRSFQRPWYSQFDRSGRVGVCKTIDCAAYTRRKRGLAKK